MIKELVVDVSVLSGLVMNRAAREAYPILNKKTLDPTGCPRCPNKHARFHVDMKSIKEHLATMTPSQAAKLKEILGAQTLVFHLTGPMGLHEVRV